MGADGKPNIPRRPKKEAVPQANGLPTPNGKHGLEDNAVSSAAKRARSADVAEPEAKKSKMAPTPAADDDDIVIVEDGPAQGAIVIDDD